MSQIDVGNVYIQSPNMCTNNHNAKPYIDGQAYCVISKYYHMCNRLTSHHFIAGKELRLYRLGKIARRCFYPIYIYGGDRMVFGFTTTCAISAYRLLSWRGVLDTILYDKVCH